MALVDPVKVYVAASNVEAQMTCRLLQEAGIEAFANEDSSPAGVWMGGTIPGVFDAGVYVSRADAERAVEVIRAREQREAERSRAQGAEVEATCEECGKTATFPAAQYGTVQDCPHCGAWLDVGEVTLPGEEHDEDALE
jgi:rubrerythrin